MHKRWLTLAALLAAPAMSQETELPRIEPEPRWDVESIRDYFRQKEVSAPASETPAAPALPSPAPIITAPKTLLHGLSSDAVMAKLGKPALDRHDGRVRLLQYSGKTCVLDVLLWRKPTTTSFIVQHVESRTLKAEKSDLVGCLQKQYAARGLKYEVAAAPIPPAPMAPVPTVQTDPPSDASAPAQPAIIPPTPTPQQPVPGLSYPLGGQQPPPK